jgi:hypothetical protein
MKRENEGVEEQLSTKVNHLCRHVHVSPTERSRQDISNIDVEGSISTWNDASRVVRRALTSHTSTAFDFKIRFRFIKRTNCLIDNLLVTKNQFENAKKPL